MAFQASCPACAAPVQFEITSSVVAVCPNCGTVCGRGDGALEAFGKVADLVQTASPLTIGLRGKYKGVPFTITGRSQLKHSAGGVWDEWYVAFRRGRRWGWLAEAQGRLYLTFQKKVPSGAIIPPLSELDIDEDVTLPGSGNYKVTEIGEATILSGEGEIPYVLKPGETVRYADLSGAGRRFATLDYSDDQPLMFVGGQVTYEKLGIADQVRDREQAERRVSAVQVNCPSCGGPLELRAPDETQRVACPFCGALNECSHGKLKFLETLGKKKIEPVIPLGTVGTLTGTMFGESWSEDQSFTVIGFLQRKVTYDGIAYRWQEYLLYRPRTPFHWLIHSDGHWSFGKPIAAGDVTSSAWSAQYNGQRYKIFDRSKPVVTYVLGEFYWEVAVGEKTAGTDFIHPPHTLSREAAIASQTSGQKRGGSHRVALDELPAQSIAEEIRDFVGEVSERPIPESVPIEIVETDEGSREANHTLEVNYTLSTYFPVSQVEKAFGVTGLRRPHTIAPNQPYPYKGVYKTAVGLLAAACLVALIVFATGRRRQVFSQVFTPVRYQTQSFFSAKPFTVKGHQNLLVTCRAPRWAYVSGEFYSEQSRKVVRSFGLPSGQSVYLSAMPAGDYTLRLKIGGERKPSASTNQGVESARRQIAQLRARQQAAARKKTPAGRRATVVPILSKKKAAVSTTPVTVTVRQGVPHVSHLFLLFAALAVVPIGMAIHQIKFEVRRWSESDFSPYSAG